MKKLILLLTCLLPAFSYSELILSGLMPEDALIQTGAVVVVEHDPEATPIAQAALTHGTNAEVKAESARVIGTTALSVAQAAVPISRTINAKALTANIVLSAADVGAVRYDAEDWAGFSPGGIFIGTDTVTAGAGLTDYAVFIGNGVFGFGGRISVDADGISQTGKFTLLWPGGYGDLREGVIATLGDIDNAVGGFITADALTPYATKNFVAESISGLLTEENDPDSLHTTGGTMTGGITLAESGITWQGVGIATNYSVRVDYDGTNVSFNVYTEAK